MNDKRLLPLARRPLDRRTILMMACAGCAAACSPPPPTPDGGDSGPDATTGDAADATMRDADAASDALDAGPLTDADRCSMLDPTAVVDVGAVETYPVGSLTRLDMGNAHVLLGRDAAGFWAWDGTCQHFGGVIQPTTSTTARCTNTEGDPVDGPTTHGSLYDKDGRNTVGPAMTPALPALDRPNYQITICGGHVVIDPFTMVPVGTRTPAT